MNRSENGRKQLEDAIINYTGIISDDIDLTDFMDEKKIHKIKTAYEYKNKLLELIEDGGEKGIQSPWDYLSGKFEFRPSELSVWSGAKGHGKSLLISQVFESFLLKNQKLFILSPEFPAHRVLHRMIIQSLGVSGATKDYSVDWLNTVKNNLWLYDQQRSLEADEVPALCRYVVQKLGVTQILIDSLMKCGVRVEDLTQQKNLVDNIQQIAHKNPVHIHLVAHTKKGSGDEKIGGLHDIKGASEIADMAENVLFVWRNKAKEMGDQNQQSNPDCILKIEAQRNGNGWIGTVPLFFKKHNFTFTEGSI